MALVDVPAISAINISFVPSMAALLISLPYSWQCLMMFSRTIMESSTTIPTDRIRADRVIRLSSIPVSFIRASVVRNEIGIDSDTITDSFIETIETSIIRVVRIIASLTVPLMFSTTCWVKTESSSAALNSIYG